MARETIELSRQIGDKHFANMAGLVLAESYLTLGSIDECNAALNVVEEEDPSYDFFVLGNIQRIRGMAAEKKGDSALAVHQYSRALTIFETASDAYHTALSNYLIGSNLIETRRRRANKHLTAAREQFQKLGIRSYVSAADQALERLKVKAAAKGADHIFREPKPSISPLLVERLAEATASRELLFRELIAVLQQESTARRIAIAELNERNRFVPFITHGYTPSESNELMNKFSEAEKKNEQSAFARARNLSILPIKPGSAPHALLIIHPSDAKLNDGGSLQPLMSVTELAMDVIGLRERAKAEPAEAEAEGFAAKTIMPGFIHSSPAMSALVEEVYKIRSSDVTVLVTGESGTGKELVSRAIHTLSNRKEKIFIPFNCTAVPKELAEGHLFGYRKGAFTGAVADSQGMIRAADGGTLFLDEVGDLPLDVQPKLLRFLQEGEVQPIGEKRPIKVDVRVIAATNMPLESKVAEGTFREDLYYRLNVIRLRVPPLRERRSEIPPIISYYVEHYSSRFGKTGITLTPQTVDLLMVCNWEGNVRQLCNEIQRIIARAVNDEVVTPDNLSPELKRSAQPITLFGEIENSHPITSYDSVYSAFAPLSVTGTLDSAVSELETRMIKGSLSRHNWNISRVATELGLTRRGLYLKLSRYGIEKAAN
jgi:transcriptional regulator with GAF, ATPase, and Fis domain